MRSTTAILSLVLVLASLVPLSSASPWSIPQKPLEATPSAPSQSESQQHTERYDGQQVWRLDWSEYDHDTREDIKRVTERLNLDVWRSSPAAIDIRISVAQHANFLGYLSTYGVSPASLSLFVPDLQSLVDQSFLPSSSSQAVPVEDLPTNGTQWDTSSLDSEFHSAYHPIEEIHSFGEALIERFGPLGVTIETIVVGKTFEGREIRGWRAKIADEQEEEEEEPESVSVGAEINVEEPVGRMAIEEAMRRSSEGKDLEVRGHADKRKKSKSDKKKGKGKGKGKGRGKKGKKGKKGKHGKEKHPKDGPGYDGIRELVVQAGQHAREWIGPASSIYFLHSILLEATSDPDGEVAKIMKAFTITVVPTINPDGYTYSRDHSRLWRKNRQDVGGGEQGCYGIDMNTNWGYKWRPSHATFCTDTFSGHEAFEAYETRAMANYLANGTTWLPEPEPGSGEPTEDVLVVGKEPTPAPAPGKRRVRAFVDLHSYGQLFMFPFAYSCDDFPPDAEMLMEAGLGVAKTMKNHGGQGYQAGQACDLTYRAPGDAIDYSYGVTDVRWSYSAELRDTGTYGFMLPPHLIRPTASEVTAGLTYLAKFIYNAEVAS